VIFNIQSSPQFGKLIDFTVYADFSIEDTKIQKPHCLSIADSEQLANTNASRCTINSNENITRLDREPVDDRLGPSRIERISINRVVQLSSDKLAIYML
jgi:hypothetical protein